MCSNGKGHQRVVYLEERKKFSEQKIGELREALTTTEDRCRNKACVYLTGSFGRGEAGDHSDLDLFLVGRSAGQEVSGNLKGKPTLQRLDQILVKADLIRTSKSLGFPPFSGDGEFLTYHESKELIDKLGDRDDDSQNTFTARLLLLLESTPLLNAELYNSVVDDVIAEYWGEYPDHSSDFLPAYLSNDILRLWRTFCINYEARTEREPSDKKAKRKIKNYKLKSSRLLTCYSSILYLLSTHSRNRTVSPQDAREMIALTPTARLEMLAKMHPEAEEDLNRALELHADFLKNTNVSEDDLMSRFANKAEYLVCMNSAQEFGTCIYRALKTIGADGDMHRLLVV